MEQEVIKAIGNGNQVKTWLEECLPDSRKYDFRREPDGSLVRVYAPAFSGQAHWNPEQGRGEFTLEQLTTRFNPSPYASRELESKKEEWEGWIILEGLRPINLWLSFSEDRAEFNVQFEVRMKLKVPRMLVGASSERVDLRVKKSNIRRYFGRTELIRVPYDLIESWSNGDLESAWHNVTWKSSYWIYYDNVRYRYDFYRWFRGLGPDPLGRLHTADYMDADTLNLMRSQISEPSTQIERAILREQDRDRLRKLSRLDRALLLSTGQVSRVQEQGKLLPLGEKNGSRQVDYR